jgi:hypothetical protein
MEACVGAHHLSRKLHLLGHNARLMPAKYVRPYSKGQKNDFRDAEAIVEAVQRPAMKFVATMARRGQIGSAPPAGAPQPANAQGLQVLGVPSLGHLCRLAATDEQNANFDPESSLRVKGGKVQTEQMFPGFCFKADARRSRAHALSVLLQAWTNLMVWVPPKHAQYGDVF